MHRSKQPGGGYEAALTCQKQDGLLAVEGSLGEERHCVGSTVLPVLNIHQKYLLEVFEMLSLEVRKWETTVRLSRHYLISLK